MKPILFLLVMVGALIWGMASIPSFDSYLLMIGLISLLVIAHEFGHFWVAKKAGVKVERFGFGLPFGPTLLEKKIGDTTFCVHPVLLGGYVSFPDDNPDSDIPQDSPLRFENKSAAARIAIVSAGVVVNFILGYVLMVLVVANWGFPGNYYLQLKEFTAPNAPAVTAGLQPGDLFIKAGDEEILRDDTLTSYLKTNIGKSVPLVVERVVDGQTVNKTVMVTPNTEGRIGIAISPMHKYEPVNNPVEIFTKSFTFLAEKVAMNFQAMGEIFTGQRDTKEVSGPVGIVKVGGLMIQQFGIAEGLVITALISVILGVMNILPIPMLDGGHLLFILFEKLQGHPVRKETQEKVIQFSFVVLVGLMCLILWNDINTHLLSR